MNSEEILEGRNWFDSVTGLAAAEVLAAYVADVIDWHQGWRPDAPHADLEELGGAVHVILGRRT